MAPAPVSPGPDRRRRRRGWGFFAAAAVVVLAIAAGVVIWAPWRTPALLPPAGLKADGSTTSAVMFRWSDPASGPRPDKYQILSSGKVVGLVAGTVTSYRVGGLAPDTAYQYRVAALRDGKRSALSAVLTVNTAAPPVSAARKLLGKVRSGELGNPPEGEAPAGGAQPDGAAAGGPALVRAGWL